jgi:hypothetical protein
MRCLKLPFRFDAPRLVADLAHVAPAEWIPHVNRQHYSGQWSGAALRSAGGAADNIVPETRDLAVFRDAALLARCDYFPEVLATFRCPLQAVRLLRLHAGSTIAEHVDRALDFEDGEVRIHVPIVTSEHVNFVLDGSRLIMAPGESWYTNVNLPHAVENAGTTDRIHLVLDCLVDDWLRAVFAATPRAACDHYALRLQLPAGTPATALVGFFAECANTLRAPGRPVSFRSEGASLILQWRGTYSWQFRLSTGSAAEEGGKMRLESSPDPDGHHRQDYAALLARLREAFPAATIAEEGLR